MAPKFWVREHADHLGLCHEVKVSLGQPFLVYFPTKSVVLDHLQVEKWNNFKIHKNTYYDLDKQKTKKTQ